MNGVRLLLSIAGPRPDSPVNTFTDRTQALWAAASGEFPRACPRRFRVPANLHLRTKCNSCDSKQSETDYRHTRPVGINFKTVRPVRPSIACLCIQGDKAC